MQLTALNKNESEKEVVSWELAEGLEMGGPAQKWGHVL